MTVFAWLLAALTLVAPGQTSAQRAAKAAHVVPTPNQLEWQREGLTAFIHFGPNTFDGREWGTGAENPRLFDPSGVDTDQWMRTLRDAGFEKVILVTKHHDGFVLWPTRYTDHSVKASPWRNGRGDLVAEFVRSARKYGLAVGFYLSPADLYQARPGGAYANGSTARTATIPTLVTGDRRRPARVFHFKLDDYNRYYLNELYELLTQYGPVEEVWFDGANPLASSGRVEHYAFDDWYGMVHALQPHAVVFPIDVNWVGNELGEARTSQWSVLPFSGTPRPDQSTHVVDPGDPQLGSVATLMNPKTKLLAWTPSECDSRLEKTWFWHAHQPPKTLAELQDLYFTSVGRNCQLLLDVPPDTAGVFDAADVARLHEFGAWIRSEFGEPAAQRDGVLLTLSKPVTFRTIELQERIADGQHIARFAVDAWSNGDWREIARGTTVGYERLLRLPAPVTSARVRVRILEARATPALARIALYR
ncbi:MAG: alpha-L-fucosidase [Vulcanimicrobiaceae bacterium]